jgi:ADP-ribose pyrophosphatase YjhB (NUDIX family)
VSPGAKDEGMTTPSRPTAFRPIKRIDLIARGLLVHRGHVLVCVSEHGHAYLPGGHVEPGEAAAGALRRELLEEAGLEVRVGRLLYVEEAGYVPSAGGRDGKPPRARHQVKLVFAVEPAGASRRLFHVKRGAGADGLPRVVSLEEGIGFQWRPLGKPGIVPVTMNRWVGGLAKAGGRARGGRGAGAARGNGGGAGAGEGGVVWRSWGLEAE